MYDHYDHDPAMESEDWRWLDENTLVLNERRRPVILTALDNELVSCAPDGTLDKIDTDSPRARLIVGAPDLKDAVIDLVRHIEPGVADVRDGDIPERVPIEVLKAKQLLTWIVNGGQRPKR